MWHRLALRARDDDGFTLVELMVVMLIVALLVTMGIFAFTSMADRAQDKDAQSDLRQAIIAEEANRTEAGAYTATTAKIKEFIPSLAINTSKPSDPGVYVDLFSTDVVCLHQESESGRVYAAYLAAGEAVRYGEFANETAALAFSCNATAPSWPTTGW